jgi:hypothetical protein
MDSMCVNLFHIAYWTVGRDGLVGIATCYGLDDPRIESWWGQDFLQCPDQPWGPPSILYNGAIPLLSLWAFMACSRVNFTAH